MMMIKSPKDHYLLDNILKYRKIAGQKPLHNVLKDTGSTKWGRGRLIKTSNGEMR